MALDEGPQTHTVPDPTAQSACMPWLYADMEAFVACGAKTLGKVVAPNPGHLMIGRSHEIAIGVPLGGQIRSLATSCSIFRPIEVNVGDPLDGLLYMTPIPIVEIRTLD